MSLRDIICLSAAAGIYDFEITHVLVTQVFQQLQLSICSLGKDRGGEGFHNFFDGDRGTGKLIFRRAVRRKVDRYNMILKHREGIWSAGRVGKDEAPEDSPNETECSHTDRLKVDITGGDLKDLLMVSCDTR